MLRKFLLIGSLLLTSSAVWAQVAPATQGGFNDLWVGAQYSTFRPDYGLDRLRGIGFYVDYNVLPRIAAEAEARFSGVLGSQDGNETQKDYLIGPSAQVYRRGRFSANAKFLLGGVWIKFPDQIGSGSYFAMAPGGNINYRISNRWSARVDYEYHFLPSAPNIPGQPSRGLTPNGWSFGVAYKVF